MWILGVILMQVKMLLKMAYPLLHSSQTMVSFVSKEKMSRARIPGKNTGTLFLPVQRVPPSCPKCGRTWTRKPHSQVNQMLGRVIKDRKDICHLFTWASWSPSDSLLGEVTRRRTDSWAALPPCWGSCRARLRDWVYKRMTAGPQMKRDLWPVNCLGNQALYLQSAPQRAACSKWPADC